MTGSIEASGEVYSMLSSNLSDVTTLNGYDYAFIHLFEGCKSLIKAPKLPATTLAQGCYASMLRGCTALTKAPQLPATTLAQGCYASMLSDCTALTQAPQLPATTLASKCYWYMFRGCSKLKEVHISATETAEGALESWLSGVSATGDFYCNPNATIFPTDSISGIPANWRRLNINEEAPAVDDLTKPLTFKATQGSSTVKLTKSGTPSGDFQTSRDGGNTWTDYTIDTAIALNTGDEVSFRAKADRTSGQDYNNYFHFLMTGKIEAWHNVMSLYRTNDFSTYESVVQYAFKRLFMDCTSLTKAPILPATTLADSCYPSMFKGCTSLLEAPALPATTLDRDCYDNMFDGCTSLTKAPALPATTLANYCYQYMFRGCSSLNEVRCQIPSSYSSSQISSSYAKNWLSNVSSTGTFYTNADANWSTGASGIPTGWTRVNEGAPAVDDLTKPLTFRATQDGSTVTLTKEKLNTSVEFYVSFQTSRDGGNTWVDYTLDSAIRLNTGDEVSFRTLYDRTSPQSLQSASKYTRFTMTGKIEAWHNVMSLYRTNDFATYESVSSHCFYQLFASCTSLTKAPALPATRLNDSCYSTMFAGCTSLKEAPELPATSCYDKCYQNMFNGCTSLIKAPALPATSLANRCYYTMFKGCSSLNEVRCQMPSTISAEDIPTYTGSGTYAWLYNVSSTGTFHTNADANWSSGASGIPTGWNRVNA